QIRQVDIAQDVEIPRVRVPAVVIDLNAVPEQVPGDVDEANPCLYEAPGDERAGAEKRSAIAVAQARIFMAQVKGLPGFRRSQHVEGTVLDGAKIARGRLVFRPPHLLIELAHQGATMIQTIDRDSFSEGALGQARFAANQLRI